MTFRTREMIRLWRGFRDELVEYWHAVRTLDFSTAHRCAEVLVAEAEDHRGCLADSCSGEVLNDQFLLETALGVLGQYAAYWDALMQEQYSWSWSSLQDTQDSLRLIKRFGRRPDILIWSAIERQCGGLERLYPYRIFVSSELTHSALECSICGRRMDDPACPHIPGDLYRGELALGIVRDIIDVFALALVRNPMDKRCVIVLPDDSERFKAVAYLRGELKSDKLDPFRLHGVEYELDRTWEAEQAGKCLRKAVPSDGNVTRTSKCRPATERERLNIVCSEAPLVEVEDLLYLRRSSARSASDGAAQGSGLAIQH